MAFSKWCQNSKLKKVNWIYILQKLLRAHHTLRGHFAPAFLGGSNKLRAYQFFIYGLALLKFTDNVGWGSRMFVFFTKMLPILTCSFFIQQQALTGNGFSTVQTGNVNCHTLPLIHTNTFKKQTDKIRILNILIYRIYTSTNITNKYIEITLKKKTDIPNSMWYYVRVFFWKYYVFTLKGYFGWNE